MPFVLYFIPFVSRCLCACVFLHIIASTGKHSASQRFLRVSNMRTIKLIQDSRRFCVTSISPNYVQGIRIADGRIVTFCRFSGKIVKNCLVMQDNQSHNRALLKKVGFTFLSLLLLLVLLFVSCNTSKSAFFESVVKNSTAKIEQVYTVKNGDNLSKIFGYKKGLQVCKLNNLKNCNIIRPQQKLKF